MLIVEGLLGLVGASIALALAARWLRVPLAVALVLGGMAMAFAPFPPVITLDPELSLALFLPPLLQVSAQRTDWVAFRSHITPILLLALGAVVFTALVVGGVAKLLMPALPWWGAVALGAIVAPPDAVAAISVLREFRIPKRLVTVLEGESLINDASSLVLYRLAVAATLAGTVSLAEAASSFVLSALGGGLIGFALGWAVTWLLTRLQDSMLEIVSIILAGFASYLVAEAFHVSGVLAAVACGGVLGRHMLLLSAQTRLEGNATWQFIEFVLTALVFLLIGMQLRGIIGRLSVASLWEAVGLAAAVSAALIVGRAVWVFGTFYSLAALRQGLRSGSFTPPISYPAVISWAGMRGVVSLATALALPESFPQRDLIVFLAFCAIFVTLVLQGTTLGPLIRRLSLEEPAIDAPSPEVTEARRDAAAAALDAISAESEALVHKDVAGELIEEFKSRAENADLLQSDADEAAQRRQAQLELRLTAIEAARAKLVERRDELDGETLATLVRELDLEEAQTRIALGDPASETPVMPKPAET